MLRTSLGVLAIGATFAAVAIASPAAAGGCCACMSGCGYYYAPAPAWPVLPPTPVPFYVVNQGPDYSGNFITTLPTIDAEGPPIHYPYIGPRARRVYGGYPPYRYAPYYRHGYRRLP